MKRWRYRSWLAKPILKAGGPFHYFESERDQVVAKLRIAKDVALAEYLKASAESFARKMKK